MKKQKFKMKRNLEIFGQSIEVIGLTFLLLATIWQAAVTDWFDQFPVKSQYYVQETANLAVLRSINRIALALDESDPIRRKAHLNEAEEISKATVFKLIEIRDQTESVSHRQATPLKLVRLFLFLFGAALIILGKALVIRHKYLATPTP